MERFWEKVDRSGSCWIWKRGLSKSGYGKFWLNKLNMRAHRAAWVITHGEVPSGMMVCHRCDTPACVRPEHLFLGTAQDNVNDMVSKRRNRTGDDHYTRTSPHKVLRGTNHGMAKLSDEQVAEARRRFSEGAANAALATEYGVSRSTMWAITKNRTRRPGPDKLVIGPGT